MKPTNALKLASLLPLTLVGQAIPENSPPTDIEHIGQLDAFLVIGSQEAVFDIPGSGIYLDSEILERFELTNINDILRRHHGK